MDAPFPSPCLDLQHYFLDHGCDTHDRVGNGEVLLHRLPRIFQAPGYALTNGHYSSVFLLDTEISHDFQGIGYDLIVQLPAHALVRPKDNRSQHVSRGRPCRNPRSASQCDLKAHLNGPVVLCQGFNGPLILSNVHSSQGFHGLHHGPKVLRALDFSLQVLDGLHTYSFTAG